MGQGPPVVFGKRRVPCVRAGLLSRCLETPAWIRAQGSHHALPRSGGEPTCTALGGGRSSLSVAVSRKSIAHICGPHPELQKLWAALCLPRRSAEREGYILVHWIVEAVALAYQSQGEACPLGVRAHSTRSVASSYALAHSASLADICRAAGWATPNTFARFYSLRIKPVSSRMSGSSREELAGVTLAVPFPLTRGYESLFSPPVQFPGRWTLVESSKHTPQSDWAEQSDARPSTSVSSPGSPVSPCTGLGVRMGWFPFG